jgi:hypothetical protein
MCLLAETVNIGETKALFASIKVCLFDRWFQLCYYLLVPSHPASAQPTHDVYMHGTAPTINNPMLIAYGINKCRLIEVIFMCPEQGCCKCGTEGSEQAE